MKKLLINEKNLPRVKPSQSSIRIRINKNQLNHENTPIKRSQYCELHDVDVLIQLLQKGNGNLALIQPQKIHSLIQILKSYKQIISASQDLMTQSMKYSKIKFKPNIQMQGKQNFTLPLRNEKVNKQASQSERLTMVGMGEKYVNGSKTGKNNNNKRLFRSSKKVTQQQLQEQQWQDKQEGEDVKQYVANVQPLIGNYTLNECNINKPNNQNNQHNEFQTLRKQLTLLTTQLKQKDEEIKNQHQRIQQLNTNIQNLIKKNTQIAQQSNKLSEELSETRLKIQHITILEKELQNIHQKYKKLEENNQELMRKKQQAQKDWKNVQKQKNQKIQQQLGRYQTAQRFYELTRGDLREENQHLIALLEQREKQITHLYQIIHKIQKNQQSSIEPLNDNQKSQFHRPEKEQIFMK